MSLGRTSGGPSDDRGCSFPSLRLDPSRMSPIPPRAEIGAPASPRVFIAFVEQCHGEPSKTKV